MCFKYLGKFDITYFKDNNEDYRGRLFLGGLKMKEIELHITVAIWILVEGTAFLVHLDCYIYLEQS